MKMRPGAICFVLENLANVSPSSRRLKRPHTGSPGERETAHFVGGKSRDCISFFRSWSFSKHLSVLSSSELIDDSFAQTFEQFVRARTVSVVGAHIWRRFRMRSTAINEPGRI